MNSDAPRGESTPEAAPQSDTNPRVAPAGRGLVMQSDLVLLGVWALLATVLGRALAPALPGSSAGIGRIIAGVEHLAAFAAQFMAITGAMMCLRVLLSTLSCKSNFFRPVAIAASAAALPIVISAGSRHLAPGWLLVLVGLSAALGFAATLPASRVAETRVAGLVISLVAMGSLVSASGRLLALYASHQVNAGLFGVARGVATVGFALDALSVALVATWLGRRWRMGVWVVSGVSLAAMTLVWLGSREQEVAGLPLVVGRALSALTAHPDPFVGSALRYFVEVSAILFAAVSLCLRRPPGVGVALAFALLSRASGDVPLCALMLMLSALLAVRASLQALRPGELAQEPGGPRPPLEVVPATR